MQKIILTIAVALLISVQGQNQGNKGNMNLGDGNKVNYDISGQNKNAQFQTGNTQVNANMQNQNGTMRGNVTMGDNSVSGKMNKTGSTTNYEVDLNKNKVTAYQKGESMGMQVKGPVSVSANTNGKDEVQVSASGNSIQANMLNKNGTKGEQVQVSGNGYNVEWKNVKKQGAEMLETRVKFDKYFTYGMESSDMPAGSKAKQCSNSGDCGGNQFQKMCCVNAVMTNRRDGTQDQMFRCMNYKLASVNFEMSIGDAKINMKCVDTQSSATYMGSAFLASMVSMILMAMY